MNELKHNKAMKETMNTSVYEVSEDELLGGGCAGSTEDDKRRGGASAKRGGGGGGANSMKSCQAEKCSADLSDAKPYHRRHKVCEHHAKAQMVVVGGIRQRFCQQCSRFHEVSEFDETKRSCRRRLAGHNERRRKNPTNNDSVAEGSDASSRMKGTSTAGAHFERNCLRAG